MDEQAVSHIKAGLDAREQIESHAILPEQWSNGDELTETLKRRRHIVDKYADDQSGLRHLAAEGERPRMPPS
jgi:hypothetical protein